MLTAQEMGKFRVNPGVIRYLEYCQSQLKIDKSKMNILDYGCGRGRTVAKLREMGYSAYGVDIDPEPIKNAEKYYLEIGYDIRNILSLIDPNGRLNHPDDFFHFVFSNQVFEHVKDIEQVASELCRVTCKGGMGLHIYPAHKYIVEGHLYMPFVHWLPKNRLRKLSISIWLVLGKDPKWKELEAKTFRQKVEVYYCYSLEKTYYRKWAAVRKIFQEYGFSVQFVTVENPRIKKIPLIGKLIKFKPFHRLINFLLLNFVRVELLLRKR